MKIHYLGTGAAEGVPAMFCNCTSCMAARKTGSVRSRSQVLLDGELSVDFPPDAYYHAMRFGVDLSAIAYLAVTHAHQDHFYAHDFILRGYKYAHGLTRETLEIFGNEEAYEVFRESTKREMREDVKEHILFHRISAFEEHSFGGWKMISLPARHSSCDPLLYLFEKDGKRVLHLTDTCGLGEDALSFLARIGGAPCGLVTLDCTFLFHKTEEGARHMGLDKCAQTLARLSEIGLVDEKTKRVVTHFSHNCAPTEEALRRAEGEYGVICAYDGMLLEI